MTFKYFLLLIGFIFNLLLLPRVGHLRKIAISRLTKLVRQLALEDARAKA